MQSLSSVYEGYVCKRKLVGSVPVIRLRGTRMTSERLPFSETKVSNESLKKRESAGMNLQRSRQLAVVQEPKMKKS